MKKNKLFKYLFGSLAGVVLAGAVIGGVVSCSNGNSTTTQTQTQPTKKTTSTTANNTISDYALTYKYNTSTIAYQDAQTQNTSEISMVTTSSDVANYSTLANEPGNLAIYTNGSTTPTAIINSANATDNSTTTTLNLTLQKDSELYNEWNNGKITNLNSLASQLGSLISFSPTEITAYDLTINYANSNSLNKLDYSTTNQPLNFYFTPNNAQWGSSSTVPLQAELSLTQNSTTDKDYVAFNIDGSSGNVINDLIADPNCIFTSDITINYKVNNKYYSDPITLNISLQPYFSKTNLWTVDTNSDNSNTYIIPGSDYTFTPSKTSDWVTYDATITTKGTGWMFADLGTAYKTYFDGKWQDNTYKDLTLPNDLTFDVVNSGTNTYQLPGNYQSAIILITPTGLILNNLQFLPAITVSNK